MEKNNQVQTGKTPCDYCSQPAVTEIGGRLYCGSHAPQDGEKRANTPADTLKGAIDSLVDLHLPR